MDWTITLGDTRTLFMPCRKKWHFPSLFLLIAFGPIFLNLKPSLGDPSISANHKLWPLVSASKYKDQRYFWQETSKLTIVKLIWQKVWFRALRPCFCRTTYVSKEFTIVLMAKLHPQVLVFNLKTK